MIIDCPPSISSLSLSALRAAQRILVPMTADQFALHGLPILLRSLEKYREVLDIKAVVAGVVLSMFPPATDKEATMKAQQYARSISDRCSQSIPPVRCLDARISRHDAYPNSFVSQTPLAFSDDPELVPLVSELQDLWGEIAPAGVSQ